MLIAAGVLRVGTLMKYMPQPVITGFTAGIAVRIFLSQIKDLLGLSQNPRMLGFIAALPEERLRETRKRSGEITAAELYRLLIEQWLEHEWDKSQPRGAAPMR